MTKEQEAIERLNRIITTKFNNDYSIDSSDKEAIETALSMLKEKDELYHKALGDLVKADRENIRLKKQIDLMARAFKQDDVRTVEEIKQYFEKLAERKSEE